MINIIRKLMGIVDRGDKDQLLSRSLLTFILNAGSIVFGFVISIILAKGLGAEGYGTYVYVFTWVNLLGMMLLAGIDKTLIREMARLFSEGNWGGIRGLFRWSGSRVFLLSAAAGAIVFIVSLPQLNFIKDSETRTGFFIAAIAIPFMSLLLHRQAALQGIKEVVRSQVPDKLVFPFLTTVTTGVLWVTGSDWLTVENAIFINFCSLIISFLVSQGIWSVRVPKAEAMKPSKEMSKALIALTLSFLLFRVSNILNSKVDVVLIGTLANEAAVGLYNIPVKLALFVSFFLTAFNAVLSPAFSSYFHKGEMIALQNLSVKASRIILVLSLPLVLVLILGREYILGFYGEEFLAGSPVLVILVLAQLYNVLTGPVGNILLMTDNQRLALTAAGIGLVVNLVLNVVLIPLYGIMGAAIATGAALAVNCSLGLLFVVKKLKFNPTCFGTIRKT